MTCSPLRTLSPHRKRKASDDYIEWWLADQQKQINFEEDPNLQSSSAEQDTLNTPSGSWILAPSNASTNSGEKLRSRNVSRGAKRVFDLKSGSASSKTSSIAASLTFKSNSPSRKRTRARRNRPDAEQSGNLTRLSANRDPASTTTPAQRPPKPHQNCSKHALFNNA